MAKEVFDGNGISVPRSKEGALLKPSSTYLSQEQLNNDSSEIIVASQEKLRKLQEAIRNDQKLMVDIAYLTTLQQLGNQSELDNLFDGDVVLGEEELHTVYALINIFNGNASFGVLRPPTEISFEQNFAPDSTYKIGYIPRINPDSKTSESYISSIKGTTNFIPSVLGDTELHFEYDKKSSMPTGAKFVRPTLAFNEKITIKRNVQGLVETLEIGNMAKVDNTIVVTYKDGKPFSVKQSKYGALEDKTFFSHDTQGNLDAIIYSPAMSVKNAKKIVSGKNIKEATKNIETVVIGSLRRAKGTDTVEIQRENGVPLATKTHLDSSRWFFRDGKSEFTWSENELKELYLEMDGMAITDKKKIRLDYN